MGKSNRVFVGCDLGDKQSDYCVLDSRGRVVEEGRVQTKPAAFSKKFKELPPSRFVIEVGTHSRWVAELLPKHGHEVIVANARQVKLIWKRSSKTDRSDAQWLARLGRADLTLLAPVHHRSRAAQRDLAVLKARDILIRSRTQLVNFVRGTMKPLGVRLPKCDAAVMPRVAKGAVPAELAPALNGVVEAIADVTAQIALYDEQIKQLGKAHPDTARLAQVPGVGPITSLAYVLTIEDPARFRRSRVAGAFLGLVPGKDQSGDHDPQKRVTRAGDPFLRRLLVQCAHSVLGWRGSASDLRAWGLALADGGGKDPKKRAVVAVARKLAVLLHRLWVSGETYQPIGYRSAA